MTLDKALSHPGPPFAPLQRVLTSSSPPKSSLAHAGSSNSSVGWGQSHVQIVTLPITGLRFLEFQLPMARVAL